jgi:hypothetical protein
LAAYIVAAQPAATAKAASLCVGLLPAQQSLALGQTAQWTVGAWAENGTVSGVTIKLAAGPSGAGSPTFSVGCAKGDGTASCALGTVASTSAQREFRAQVAVPLTANITAVDLSITGSATGIHTDPHTSSSIAITATGSASAPNLPALNNASGASVPTPILSPGGSAAGLFPVVMPAATTSAGPDPKSSGSKSAREAASLTALTGPADTTGAETAGLVALALAVLFAVTRLTVRRRHAPTAAVAAGTGAAPPLPEPTAAPMPVKPPEPAESTAALTDSERSEATAQLPKRDPSQTSHAPEPPEP